MKDLIIAKSKIILPFFLIVIGSFVFSWNILNYHNDITQVKSFFLAVSHGDDNLRPEKYDSYYSDYFYNPLHKDKFNSALGIALITAGLLLRKRYSDNPSTDYIKT